MVRVVGEELARTFEGTGGDEEAGVCVLAGSLEAMSPDGDLRAGEVAGSPRVIECTIIRPGDSNNRMRYRPEVLREAVGLFEGAAAFCDHPGMMDVGRAGGRSLRDLVGVYEGVRWDETSMSMRASLRLYPGAEWMATMMRQAMADREAGRASPNVGVSADMIVIKAPILEGGGLWGGRLIGWDVKKIVKVNSADVVFQPAAGGRFDRILEGVRLEDRPPAGGLRLEEGVTLCTRCNQDPCRCEGGSGIGGTAAGATATVDRVQGAEAPGTVAVPAAPTGAPGASVVPEISRELEAVRTLRLELSQAMLAGRLAAANLPAPAQEYIRGRLAGRAVEAAEVDAEIAAVRGLLGGIVAPSVVTGMGPGAGRIEVGRGAVERVQLAMDRLFGVKIPDAASDVPRFSGIREAYLVITGDTGFTGRYDWERSTLAGTFGVAREADEVTTSVMSLLLANSMTKRLVADYQAQPKWWLPIAVRTTIRDMKQQDRVLLNDFAVLPTVNENAAYVNLAWDDVREQYTPAKKGSVVYVTLETIMNDDLRGVARIPSKLAAAAVVTINEFVSGLFTANAGNGPAMADGQQVFNAANHQGNRATAALSSSTLKDGMVVLAKMTNAASKRIGVIGRYLLVPPDLLYVAQVIAGSAQEPGTANNDINVLQGKVVPIAVPQFTDTNNWYLLADPAQVECLELGFLNGREEPELLVQDNPTAGTVFTNDAISFKIRWIFGGGWLDYRGAYGSIVA